ncbi:MAG TPA: efflux RND transporter periplasmic adaptor subunit [Anaerolineae bacterium]|nr:efflux RND transporter periplasmic adaptor subunit [Anaerolineae bacterium]
MSSSLGGQGKNPALAKPKFNRKFILAILGLIIIAAIAWWQIALSSAGTPVKTSTVTRGDIEVYISAPSKVTLPSRSDLSFKAGGKIAAIHVKKDDEVVAGQMLADLDMTSIYPQISQAEASLKVAQANLDKLLSGRNQYEIAVAKTSVGQAATAVKNARRNLNTVQKLVAQGKQKAALNVENAEAGLNIAKQQLRKIKNGARTEELAVADAQVKQASQALEDAKSNYDRVKELNDQLLNEADQTVASAKAALDEIAKTDTATAAYASAKSAYDTAVAARNRVIATNNQSLRAAQAQVNSAKGAYDTAMAQYNAAKAGARSEDMVIAENQVRQAEIALEIARIGTGDASLDAQLDAAQAQLDNAIQSSRIAAAQFELQNNGPGAADIHAAQGQIEQAQAQLASAEAVAEDAILKAPFSGRVAAVNGRAGEIAGLNATSLSSGGESPALITLINFDRVELSADVDEVEVGKLKIGQDVRVALDAYENKIFDGKLTDISLISSKNSTGGTVFPVTVIVNPGKDEFREGMSGDVEVIISKKRNVLVTPFDAVKVDGKKSTVYVVKDGVAYLREVTTGLSSDTAYEVVSGLKEGEVIATGKVALTDGQRVKAEKDERTMR